MKTLEEDLKSIERDYYLSEIDEIIKMVRKDPFLLENK